MDAGDLESLPSAVLAELVRRLHARVAALEAAVAALRGGGPPPKTPANSSVPPANGWKARRPRPPADGARPKRGPKYGHIGASRWRARAAQVAVVLACRPRQCGDCGAALPPAGGTVVAHRQLTALPPVRPARRAGDGIEAQRWRVRCRHCGHGPVADYPPGCGARGTFGPRLVATAARLHEEHHVAYARLVEVVGDLFGLSISEGALVEAVGRLGQALLPAAAALAADVRAAPVIGSDQTSARVDGVTWWEWVFQTPTAAYHTIQRRRNTAVVRAFLNGVQPQVWVSDLWKPQRAAGAGR